MSTATRRRAKSRQVWILPIDSIFPSPENDKLYQQVDLRDPEIQAMADSMRIHGVLEPLLVSKDHCIISGCQSRRNWGPVSRDREAKPRADQSRRNGGPCGGPP